MRLSSKIVEVTVADGRVTGVRLEDGAVALQIPSVNEPGLAPPGKHAASAFSLCFPPADARSGVTGQEGEKGTTFTPKHMGTMFAAPGGDYCHGLIHPDQIGPNRPGPKGYVAQPIAIDGLYLASAGCHGGPGVTFISGYNAAKQALAES